MGTFGVAPGDPVDAGVNAAVERTWRYGLRIETPGGAPYQEGAHPAELNRPIELTRELLNQEEASPRFCEMFAEMVAVASIARHHYGDPPLSELDLADYLQHSFSIFNSFRHA